jgi:glycosyltransferase involved in cell wall biosynthesis
MSGRLDPSKNYETAIKAIALSNHKPTLVINGLLEKSRSTMIKYASYLKKFAEKHRVKLKLNINIPLFQYIQVMKQSEMFIHCMKDEPFGIVVAEAQASGCATLVYKSGGPFYDIIDRGKYGLSFSTVTELAKHIDNLIDSKEELKMWQNKALKGAERFTYQNFRSNVKLLIENASNYR